MVSNVNTTFDYPMNFSNGTAITGIGGIFEYAQYVTDGMFSAGILLMIFLMSFGIGMVTGMKKALAASSFITFIFSVYFVRLDMVNPIVPIVLLFIAIIGALGSKAEGGM